MAFRHAREGLHPSVRRAVDRRGRPVGAVFGVGQPFAVAGLAEFASRVFGRAPPYARLQAVFQSHHGFHDVVHFVGGGMFAVFPHGGEELREVVETAGQLVGVSFVNIVLQVVEPRECPVAVERVAAANADIVEARVLTQLDGHLPESLLADFFVGVLVARHPLVPAEVRLVERGDGDDFVARVLVIARGHVDEVGPCLGVLDVAVVHGRVVAVDEQLDVILAEAEYPDAFVDGVFLRLLQVAVHQRVGGLERRAHDVQVVLPHEGRAAAHVVFIQPGDVGAPFHLARHAGFREPEGDDAVGGGRGRQAVAGTGALCVCGRQESPSGHAT